MVDDQSMDIRLLYVYYEDAIDGSHYLYFDPTIEIIIVPNS